MIDAGEFREVSPGSGAPQVSVLMPVYEQEGFVQDAIESVLGQTDVSAEILISDDCSADRTFALAERTVTAWLEQGPTPHRILLRRGRSRLRRDHLPVLAEAASCDILIQAHGDDLSHPLRCKVLLDVFNADRNCALAANLFTTMPATGKGEAGWEKIGFPYPASKVPIDIIINQSSDYLIGCAESWRRSSLAPFGRLDTSVASVGHDRIMPFRASLVGYVAMVQLPLLVRRIHDKAWSRQMVPDRGAAALFGWDVVRVNCLHSMMSDLDVAHERGLIDAARHSALGSAIRREMLAVSARLSAEFDDQTKRGLRLTWIAEDRT